MHLDKYRQKEKEETELQLAFDAIDESGSGELDSAELLRVFMHLPQFFVDKKLLEELRAKVDPRDTEYLTFDEFYQITRYLPRVQYIFGLENEDVPRYRNLFLLSYENEDGRINITSAETKLKDFQKINELEVDLDLLAALSKEAVNKDITFSQFCQLMSLLTTQERTADETFKIIFNILDSSCQGFLSIEETKQMFKILRILKSGSEVESKKFKVAYYRVDCSRDEELDVDELFLVRDIFLKVDEQEPKNHKDVKSGWIISDKMENIHKGCCAIV